MPHYIQFYNNFIKNKTRLSVENAAKKMMIPHLIIHGDNDLSVPFLHAQNLHRWNTTSKLIVVPKSNHVFGASQPWTKTKLPTNFKFVLEKTIAFPVENQFYLGDPRLLLGLIFLIIGLLIRPIARR